MRRREFPGAAAGLLLLMLVTVFFPSLFLGRVISPVDTLFDAPPWLGDRRASEAANPTLEPVAVSALPAALELRRDLFATAVWDPYRGAGGPGTLRWDRGLLWPFGLPGLLLLDEAYLVNGMVMVRLVVAFVGLTLLLGTTGVRGIAAAAGGAAFALSGPLVTRWADPGGAALATLPLLLFAVEHVRSAASPWRRMPILGLAWLAFLAAGDPPTTALGGVLAIGLGLRPGAPRRPGRLSAQLGAPAAAAAILAPAFLLAALTPSGQLPAPVRGWGSNVLSLLVDPFAWGSPRSDTYLPPIGLGSVAFADACLAVGWVTLALAAIGTIVGGRRSRGWTIGVAAALAALAFGPVGRIVAVLPGVDGAGLARIAGLAALGLAGLAAFGLDRLLQLSAASWRSTAGGLIAAAVVLEGGFLAGHLWPHLTPGRARIGATPAIRVAASLLDPLDPWRAAPLQDALPPDTATVFGIEDVRGSGPPDSAYRRIFEEIDPQASIAGELRLNAATADLRHPLLDLLGVRLLLEPPQVRLVEFGLGQDTLEVEPRDRVVGPLGSEPLVQELTLPEGCSRLGLHATDRGGTVAGTVTIGLEAVDRAAPLGSWRLDATALARDGLTWLDLPAAVDQHRHVRLRVRAEVTGSLWLRATSHEGSLAGQLTRGGRALGLDLAPSFDTSGYARLYEGADLRLWENRRALQRAFAVRRVVAGDLETLTAARPPLDTASTVVLPQAVAAALPPMPDRPLDRDERVTVVAATPSSLRIETVLRDPAVLVVTLRFSPLWRARVDAHPVRLEQANGLFLALPIGEGRRTVEIGARVPTLWYGVSAAGVALLIVIAAFSRRRLEP